MEITKERVSELEARSVEQEKKKTGGKIGPTFLWDNNKTSDIWVFRVLEEEGSVLQKNIWRKNSQKLPKYCKSQTCRFKKFREPQIGETQQNPHPNTL